MSMHESQGSWQRLLRYALGYAIWLLLAGLSGWCLLVWRDTLIEIAIVHTQNPWQVRAADQFGLLLLGIVWLVGVIVLEHRLRIGASRHQLLRRTAQALVYVGAALLLAAAARMLFGAGLTSFF